MTDDRSIDLGTVWLADGIFAAAGDNISRLGTDRIKREIEVGSRTLDDAVKQLSARRRTQPGEFGIELVGSAALAFLLPVLHHFIERYIKKLTEAAADHAATITVDRLKNLLRKDVRENPELIIEQLEQAFSEYGEAAGINPQDSERFLAVIRDKKKLITITHGEQDRH